MSEYTNHVSAGPIFIGGLSYSGKTPLRLMLSSHPLIVLSRRTYMWQRYYGRFGDLSRPDNLERCLEAMLARKSIQALSPDPERIRREFWRGPATYSRLFEIIHCQFALSIGKRRWGAQIGLIEEYADVIFDDYPAARMIHMIRDPRARQGSVPVGRRRAGKTGWETARWLHSARLARRNETRYVGRYLVVSHEALLADREGQLRDMCDFLGERFYPEMVTTESAVRFGDQKPVASYAFAGNAAT
ncbi:MAG: sulfotransferase, partial [Chloroflexota bacterium]